MDALHLAILMTSLKLMGKIIFPPFCRKLDEKDSGIGSKIILKFREPNASTSRLLKG